MAATTVVGICGPPGGGKTSLAIALMRTLSSASVVFFDHYEQVTEQPLEDIVAWLEEGADCNVFTIPGLAEDLARLKGGQATTDPRTGQLVEPAKYVLFETPFGREHRATGRHIDLLLWIDIPLDVAMARNVRAFSERFVEPPAIGALEENMRWLKRHMDEYLSVVRPMLVHQQSTVPLAADIRIDGHPVLGTVTENAAREIMLAVARAEASA